MAKLTLESIIDELEEYIDSCKVAPFSGGKVSVPKEEFLNQLEELKMEIPAEVERSREIVARKDMILAEANANAEKTTANAAKKAKQLIEDSNIVEMARMREKEIIDGAKAQAAQILEDANREADTLLAEAKEEAVGIQIGALKYTSGMMAGLEDLFQKQYDLQKEQYTRMVEGLGTNLDKIKYNRAEIDTQLSIWVDQEDMDEE